MNYSIETAILNTMLECEYFHNEKPFKLDSQVFTYPYNKRVAERINETIDKEDSLSLLSFLIQDKSANTKHEQDFLEILTQTPLVISVARKYHDYLKMEYVRKMVK